MPIFCCACSHALTEDAIPDWTAEECEAAGHDPTLWCESNIPNLYPKARVSKTSKKWSELTVAKHFARAHGCVIRRSAGKRFGLFANVALQEGVDFPVWGNYRTQNPKDVTCRHGVFTLEYAKTLLPQDQEGSGEEDLAEEARGAFLFVEESCFAGYANDPFGPDRSDAAKEEAEVRLLVVFISLLS